MQAIDRGVSSIAGALQQTNRWVNTLFIFMSDNGLSWGEHRLLDRKECPYEECIRVPFIVRVPGVPPRQDPSLVANIDIGPTIADWAGAIIPAGRNGRSLLPLINNPGTPWRTEILFEQLGRSPTYLNFSGIRTAQYMYTEYGNNDKELYDLAVDPFQLTNVAAQPANAALVAVLAAILGTLKSS